MRYEWNIGPLGYRGPEESKYRPEDWAALMELAREVGMPLVRETFLGTRRVVAYECPDCGAPVGNEDPDRADRVHFRQCSDCRE